jgi:hypothetical protein
MPIPDDKLVEQIASKVAEHAAHPGQPFERL